jgi:hypothetical protein
MGKEFKFFNNGEMPKEGSYYDQLDAASTKKETVNILLEAGRHFETEITRRHGRKIDCFVWDATKAGGELYGWVFTAKQQVICPALGIHKRDQYSPAVVRIDISELEVNEGEPKVTISWWKDSEGNIDGGKNQNTSLTPHEVVAYWENILDTGDAFPVLSSEA